MQADPAILETTQCLCLAARRAARTITRGFDDALRGHGLRATQFTLLAALRIAGPQAIGELAELLSADRTTLTRNLAVMEQHGWVSLAADRDDARARIATIAPQGARVLAAALPAWRAAQRRLTAQVGSQAAAGLRQLAGGPCASTPSDSRSTPRNSRKENRR